MSKAIMRWMFEGERGSSSECMAAVALGFTPRHNYPPADPADLNRCLKLVKAAPSVRGRFKEIAALSKQWKAVIDHWDELETMFVAEVGWNWSNGQSAPKTYKRMKALGL